MSLKAYVKDKEIDFKYLTFSGGEPHIEILSPYEMLYGQKITIDARLATADDFLGMILLANALGQYSPHRLHLYIPYFPGARQDRKQPGFGFTLEMYADILNEFSLNSVTVLDPHSKVVEDRLIDCTVQPIEPIVDAFLKKNNIRGLICPDTGAIDRTQKQAAYSGLPVVNCSKNRDPKTGQLTGFLADPIPFSGNWCIVDDICDGGGTFIGLADLIMSRDKVEDHRAQLFLWTTHGIYSKGFGGLLEHFHALGCTDSFPGVVPPGESTLQVTKINYKGEIA